MTKSRRSKRRARIRADLSSGIAPANVGAVLIDHEAKKLIVVTKDILLNQLRRDGPKIAESFDALCGPQVQELSSFLADTSAILLSGLMHAKNQNLEMKSACGELLMNAAQSFGAAVAAARTGYMLQPGILIRSMLEAISTVCHLVQRPSDFTKYQQHKLPSPKTVNSANKVIPDFGRHYAFFSDNFAHIGHLHKSVQAPAEFKEMTPALETNLSLLRLAAWLLYVTTELLFAEIVGEPRYWHGIPEGFKYEPSEAECHWMRGFFGAVEL